METTSNFELFPWENGKTWVVAKSFTIIWHGHKLTIIKGFQHDKYTFAPDLPDERPAVCHDFALEVGLWDDGTPIKLDDANQMCFDLMKASDDQITRNLASTYFFFLRIYWTLSKWKQKWFGKYVDTKSST